MKLKKSLNSINCATVVAQLERMSWIITLNSRQFFNTKILKNKTHYDNILIIKRDGGTKDGQNKKLKSNNTNSISGNNIVLL